MSVGRLTTAQAAERLGVKPETLYAYVSRGLIERHRTPGGVSTFAARDVERLARAGKRTKSLPPVVFPSGLTSIADGRYSYRGVDAVRRLHEAMRRISSAAAEFARSCAEGQIDILVTPPHLPVRPEDREILEERD